VVVKIPPRHKVIAGVHLLNLGSTDLDSELRMALEIVHPRTVEVVVAPFRLTYRDLHIPAGKRSRFSGTCTFDKASTRRKAGVPLDLKLYHVLPHITTTSAITSASRSSAAPATASRSTATRASTPTPTAAPSTRRSTSPAPTGLRFTCGYDNWRDKEIGYGIGDQEMCVMLGLADMRVMMNASVDSGTQLVGADGDTLLHEGPCSTIALPKNAAQAMPTPAELAAPLYVPPAEPGDVDLDPVKKCVDIPADATPLEPATLTSLRETIFNPSCTFSSCHGGKTPVSPRLDGADLHAQLLAPASQTNDAPRRPRQAREQLAISTDLPLRPQRRRPRLHPHALQLPDPARAPPRREAARVDRGRRARGIASHRGGRATTRPTRSMVWRILQDSNLRDTGCSRTPRLSAKDPCAE
jgi:hypothetical protein